MESKTNALCLPKPCMAGDDGSWAALALDGNRNCQTLQKMSPFVKASNADLADKLNMLNGCWVWGRGCFPRTQIEEEPNAICKLQAEAWTGRCLVSWNPSHPETSMKLRKGPRCSSLSQELLPQLPSHAHTFLYVSQLCNLNWRYWGLCPLAQEMYLAQHLSKIRSVKRSEIILIAFFIVWFMRF